VEDIIETIQVKKLDEDFKNQIMKEPVGDKLTRCFTCGICSAREQLMKSSTPEK